MAATVGGSAGVNMSRERPEATGIAARLLRATFDWHVGGGNAGFDASRDPARAAFARIRIAELAGA